MFNGYNAIMEEGWKKVDGLNDFLGSVHAREVVTACVSVVIIEDRFNFCMHE